MSVCVFVWRFRRCGVEQTRQRFRRSVNLSVRLSARLDQGSGKVKVEEEGTAKTDQQPLAVVSLMSLMRRSRRKVMTGAAVLVDCCCRFGCHARKRLSIARPQSTHKQTHGCCHSGFWFSRQPLGFAHSVFDSRVPFHRFRHVTTDGGWTVGSAGEHLGNPEFVRHLALLVCLFVRVRMDGNREAFATVGAAGNNGWCE